MVDLISINLIKLNIKLRIELTLLPETLLAHNCLRGSVNSFEENPYSSNPLIIVAILLYVLRSSNICMHLGDPFL